MSYPSREHGSCPCGPYIPIRIKKKEQTKQIRENKIFLMVTRALRKRQEMDVMASDGQWVPMGGCQGNLTKRGRLSRALSDEKGGCRGHVSEEYSKQRKAQSQRSSAVDSPDSF